METDQKLSQQKGNQVGQEENRTTEQGQKVKGEMKKKALQRNLVQGQKVNPDGDLDSGSELRGKSCNGDHLRGGDWDQGVNTKGLEQIGTCGKVRLGELGIEQGDGKRSQAFVKQREELLQQILSNHGMESKVSGSHQKIPGKITGKVFISSLLALIQAKTDGLYCYQLLKWTDLRHFKN